MDAGGATEEWGTTTVERSQQKPDKKLGLGLLLPAPRICRFQGCRAVKRHLHFIGFGSQKPVDLHTLGLANSVTTGLGLQIILGVPV